MWLSNKNRKPLAQGGRWRNQKTWKMFPRNKKVSLLPCKIRTLDSDKKQRERSGVRLNFSSPKFAFALIPIFGVGQNFSNQIVNGMVRLIAKDSRRWTETECECDLGLRCLRADLQLSCGCCPRQQKHWHQVLTLPAFRRRLVSCRGSICRAEVVDFAF